MEKYHINRKGEAAQCRATTRPCPLGGEHFDSAEEAMIHEYGSGPGDPTPARPLPISPVTKQPITEEIFEEHNENGEYQGTYEEYLASPGMYYSNSTPEARRLWDRAYALIDEHGAVETGYESKENSLGDQLDWAGLIDHTGCVDTGLDNILEYDMADSDSIPEVEGMLAEWRRYAATVPNAVN